MEDEANFVTTDPGQAFVIQPADQLLIQVIIPRSWLVQAAQPLARGQGRLSWNVANPFDTWDSGRDSRCRFAYDDGRNRGTVAAASGPLAIPTDPWYVHYGRCAGGLFLLALLSSPLILYARRVRTHRRSPVGRAEAALHLLRQAREDLLPELHRLVADDDWAATVLPHVPGLARDAGENTLADLAEGYYLVLTRPDAPRTAEGLRLLVAALHPGEGLAWEKEVRSLYNGCLGALEAGSLSRIAALRGRQGNPGSREEQGAGCHCRTLQEFSSRKFIFLHHDR